MFFRVASFMHRTLLIYWAWVLRSCNRFTFIQSHYIFLLFTAFKWNTELWHRKSQNSIGSHINLFTCMLRPATLCRRGGLLMRRLSNLQGIWSGVGGGLKSDATDVLADFTLQGRITGNRELEASNQSRKYLNERNFLKLIFMPNKNSFSNYLCWNWSSGNIALKNPQTGLSANV